MLERLNDTETRFVDVALEATPALATRERLREHGRPGCAAGGRPNLA